MFTDTMGSLKAQIATHFVTLGFFCLLLPLVIITPEVRTQVQSQICVRATILTDHRACGLPLEGHLRAAEGADMMTYVCRGLTSMC